MTTFADLVTYMAMFLSVCSGIVWYFLYRLQKNINKKMLSVNPTKVA